MKTALVLLGFLLPLSAFSYQAEFPPFEKYDDFVRIENPTVQRSYYATLDNFPHTYQLNIDRDTELFLQLFEPESEESLKNQAIIIVRQENQGVKEVDRVPARKASWEEVYWFSQNESYLTGVTYTTTLPPGLYLMEVSTPDNVGQYVLRVGKDRPLRWYGYFKDVKDVFGIKGWLGKSALSGVATPLVYVPFLLILTLVWWRLRYTRSNA